MLIVESELRTSEAFLHKRGIPVIRDKETGEPMEVRDNNKEESTKKNRSSGAKFDLAKKLEKKDNKEQKKKLLKVTRGMRDDIKVLKTIRKSMFPNSDQFRKYDRDHARYYNRKDSGQT